MSRTFFSLHRKRGYSSRHPVPCQLRGTVDSRVSSCGLLVLLRSISAVPSLISSDDADRFPKLASAAVVWCQPWIYLRLVAWCFFGIYAGHDLVEPQESVKQALALATDPKHPDETFVGPRRHI